MKLRETHFPHTLSGEHGPDRLLVAVVSSISGALRKKVRVSESDLISSFFLFVLPYSKSDSPSSTQKFFL
jgi:hypothetical protein